jgi:hypothetical protein
MMKKDIKAEIMALRSTLKGKLFDDAQVHSDIYELNKLLNKMDTKEKTHTSDDCDNTYSVNHIHLRSIDEEVNDE